MAHPPYPSDPHWFADAERPLAQKLAGIPALHPRLHFGPDGAHELRQCAVGTHRRCAQLLFVWVERCREWSPPNEAPDSALNGADFRVDPSLDMRLLGLVEGPGFCCAARDATAAFAAELGVARYVRHLVMIEGCLVIYDSLRLATPATRAWNRFQWTLHCDPSVHRLSCAGSSAAWRPHSEDTPALVLDVLEPGEFAWEIATLHSQGGAPMIEALRLVRPEWYSDRMRALAVLSWKDSPGRPSLQGTEEWLGVTWPERPERTAIAFRLAPDEAVPVSPPAEQTLGDGRLWLFG